MSDANRQMLGEVLDEESAPQQPRPRFRTEPGANMVSNGSLNGSQNGLRYPDVVNNLTNDMVSMSLTATDGCASLELVDSRENIKVKKQTFNCEIQRNYYNT